MPARTIESIERLNNSRSGNPRYCIGFTDKGSAPTKSDADFVYEIGNPGMRVGDAVFVTHSRGKIDSMATRQQFAKRLRSEGVSPDLAARMAAE